MWFLEHVWLIPVVPAAAYFVILLVGRRLPMKGAEVALLGMATSLVLSAASVVEWIRRVDDVRGSGSALGRLSAIGQSLVPRAETGKETSPFVAPVIRRWTWWQSGGQKFELGTHVDGLTVVILFVVSLITTLVLVYSLEYMRGDRRFTYFFAAMSLFAAGMLTMVSAANTLQFLLGWEVMGVCSFMLIGHWWEEYPNARAALKAFFTVRTGDVGILIGFVILFFGANSYAQKNFGTSGFDIASVNAWANSGGYSRALILTAGVALLWATIGKSGQFPLHTWLPDAMAGPTPVSSLLHSSTMVVAGVFLIARFYPVFWHAFHIADGGWNWVAIVGGTTIVIAAALAFVQVDIKKVLAYSTVSQLGYMVMGLGVGAWTASVFHIFTHAWFKALLFLCAGSVSHSGSHHSFDMKRDMGGLRKHMPITFVTWIIGSLALAGIFPLAGFFSKDEIIANAGHNGYRTFMIIGLIGAFMTAAYMARATYLTFFGEYRGAQEHGDLHETPAQAASVLQSGGEVDDPSDVVAPALAAAVAHDVASHPTAGPTDGHATAAGHAGAGGHGGGHDDHGHAGPHESPPLITVPLMILAVLAIFSGLLLAPAFHIEKFKEWFEPSSAAVPVTQVMGEPASSGTAPAATTATPAATATAPPEGSAQLFPVVDHAPFEWSGALLSVAIAVSGIVVGFGLSVLVYEREFLAGFTRRNVLAKAGYAFLWNKYYLDDLYEGVIVAGISGPVARAANFLNQRVIDGVVNGVGVGTRTAGEWVYDQVDQGVVDRIVNGAGEVAEETGKGLRPTQSGFVQQYGALLFGAAAIGALVLIFTV